MVQKKAQSDKKSFITIEFKNLPIVTIHRSWEQLCVQNKKDIVNLLEKWIHSTKLILNL